MARQTIVGTSRADVFDFNTTSSKDTFTAKNFSKNDTLVVPGQYTINNGSHNIVVRNDDGDSYFIKKTPGLTVNNIKIVASAPGAPASSTADTGGGSSGGGSSGGGASGGGSTPSNGSYIGVFGMGQSLMSATNSVAINTKPMSKAWMINWSNIQHDALGPGATALGTSKGLVPYKNAIREVEGAGVIDGFHSVMPNVNVVFGQVASGGKSIGQLTTGVHHANAKKQLEAMVAEMKATGKMADKFLIHWEHGQKDTGMSVSAYKNALLKAYNSYDQIIDNAAGKDIDVYMGITQVRSYSKGNPAKAQFDLAKSHDMIEIFNTEAEFQFKHSASATDTTHLNGQGQYVKGKDTGADLADWVMSGTPDRQATVKKIDVNGKTLDVHFDHLTGSLRKGDWGYNPGNDLGAGLFTAGLNASGMPKLQFNKFVDNDTIRFTMDKTLKAGSKFVFNPARDDDNIHGSSIFDGEGMIPFQYFTDIA